MGGSAHLLKATLPRLERPPTRTKKENGFGAAETIEAINHSQGPHLAKMGIPYTKIRGHVNERLIAELKLKRPLLGARRTYVWFPGTE